MAIARDQTPAGSVAASGTTATLTWSTAPAPGSKVLVAVYCATSTVSTVKDNGTVQTTFTDDKDNAGASGWAYIFRGDGIHLPSGGSYAVTVTFAGTATDFLLAGRSYTGVATGAPAATGTTSSTSNAPNTGNVTPAAANSLLFGFFIDGSSASETITLTTSGANSVYSSSAGTVINGAVADNIPSATVSQDIAWSLSDSVGWGALIAAYSPAPVATAAQALVPPAPFTPLAFRRRTLPTAAPVLVTAADTGTGTDSAPPPALTYSASAQPGRARPGQAQPGNPGPPVATAPQVPYTLLTPPGIASPMSFQRHAFPSPAPVQVTSAETGSGADTSSLTASVSDSDSGSGTDSGTPTAAVTGSETGSGTDQGGIPGSSFPLVPPGFASPMGWRSQAWPSPAPVLVPSQDTGAGADSSQVTADASDADSGSAADTSALTAGASDTDSGSGADTGGIPGASFPLTPPGLASPMAVRFQSWPSPVPALVPAQDAGTGTDSGQLTADASDSDTGSGTDTSALTAGVSDSDTGNSADTGAASAIGTIVQPLIPPGIASPMAFQGQRWPTQAPLGAASQDAGTGADSSSLTASVSDSDTGSAAEASSLTASASDPDTGSGADTAGAAAAGAAGQPLVPPGFGSPMAWQAQAWPSQAPPEAPSQDTGAAADAGSLTATVSDSDTGSGTETASLTVTAGDTDTGSGADTASAALTGTIPSAVLIPPAPFTPMGFQRAPAPQPSPPVTLVSGSDTGSEADSGAVTAAASDSDTGTGTDTATVGVPDADTGSGTDQGGTAGVSLPLIPPGFSSPAAFQWQAWPSVAAPGVPSGDSGSGSDAGTVTAGVSGSDAGTGTDTATVTVPGSDTGSGTDAALAGAPGQSYPLVPPGRQSPMAWRLQAPPAAAPLQATDSDAGTGTDTATVTVPAYGAGNMSAVPGAAVPGRAVPGRPLTLPATAPPSPYALLVPPGRQSPMAWQFRAGPSGAPLGVYGSDTGTVTDTGVGGPLVTDADSGTGADSSGWAPPVTGAGTVQRLNPVRESMTGLDVSLYLSTALGSILQFANHGSERLYVLAQDPGVTLTVTDGALVLGQAAQPFPAVELQAGALYCFGPFHSVLQVPGTSTIQVALSTTYGVQVVVVQGPDAH